MPRSKKRAPEVEEVRPYLEGVAKNLVEKLYGPAGPAWGTRLTESDDGLLALRDLLTEKLLDDALGRRAAARAQAPAPLRGPTCPQPLACGATSERLLQTRAGEAEWAEPGGYCTRCRRAFFPAVQESGP